MDDVERAGDRDPVFFPVGKLKLAVLCVCTLGLYEFYWFFQNWRLVCKRSGFTSVWGPLLRSLLAGIFCYSLFKRIDREARSEKLRGFHPGWTAIAWILLHLSWRLPDAFALVSFLGFLPLLHVQTSVERLNAELAPRSSPNRRLSPANWAVCALGCLLLVAAFAGVAGPVEGDELAEDLAAEVK
jgi:hypothetical protein